ncbi:hypothetical protein SAMN05660649_02161 [Desulfotomaculum arcticum]|uniref:Uncharacterized protein n=1 Tax=Desulfotruncus arcticus DSM 17038 TaxID=1121424 RepID=A0A1I2TGD9_9FIRM|nr:hypothetical protein [Desulfotruncus arcticus]SFG62427.1 hypothetical protein SAMN05660649_02161 [Desulfotomaculum arcticum] [Desulfotruncus arcticus DSM 17038]
MFKKEIDPHHTGMLVLTLTSVALTIPFIWFAKSMADSLHTIAVRKSNSGVVKRYQLR